MNTDHTDLTSSYYDDVNNVTSIEGHGVILRPMINEMVLTICIIIID